MALVESRAVLAGLTTSKVAERFNRRIRGRRGLNIIYLNSKLYDKCFEISASAEPKEESLR